ncbi:hypothetical protein YC2023_106728 [Brassica napus]
MMCPENEKPVDQAKGRDQPKSFAITNFHFRSKVLVFGLWSSLSSFNKLLISMFD